MYNLKHIANCQFPEIICTQFPAFLIKLPVLCRLCSMEKMLYLVITYFISMQKPPIPASMESYLAKTLKQCWFANPKVGQVIC